MISRLSHRDRIASSLKELRDGRPAVKEVRSQAGRRTSGPGAALVDLRNALIALSDGMAIGCLLAHPPLQAVEKSEQVVLQPRQLTLSIASMWQTSTFSHQPARVRFADMQATMSD